MSHIGSQPKRVPTAFTRHFYLDGNWGTWGTWASCSQTCGGGIQYRTRSCDSPVPANGGTTCGGSASESQSCNTLTCGMLFEIYRNLKF